MHYSGLLTASLVVIWLLIPVSAIEAQSSASAARLEPAKIELGNVGHGHRQTIQFSVVNQTKGELTIEKIRPTCGCIKILPHDLRTPLGPTETRSFSAEISLGRGWGAFHKKIEVSIRGQGSLFLPVDAWFHPDFRISALDMVFATAGAVQIPESTRTIEIINKTGGDAPEITELRTEDPRWQARLLKTLADRCVIEVTASSQFPTGRIVGKVHGLCNGLPFIIPLRGRSFEHVIYEPQAWNLKQVQKSGFSTQTLKLRRADGKPLRVLSSRVDLSRTLPGLDISVTQKVLDDGSVQLQAYIAEPIPLKPGSFFGKITLSLDSKDEQQLVIDLLGLVRIGRPKP